MNEGDGEKYKFLTTQADFTALAVDGNGAPKVIMGEFKTLIERSVPYGRVIDTRSLKQTLCNASLFQMQTGVQVDLIMQVFVSRRESPSVFYASCKSLKDVTEEAGEIFRHTQKSISTRVKLTNDKTGLIHFDGKYLCAFKNGYPETPDAHPDAQEGHRGPLPKLRAITTLDENDEVDDGIVIKNDGLNWVDLDQVYVEDAQSSTWTKWRDIPTATVSVTELEKKQVFVAIVGGAAAAAQAVQAQAAALAAQAEALAAALAEAQAEAQAAALAEAQAAA
ncbi:MAG: hypothetical protein QMC37_09865, partial [Flavobacteriales bacterium]